MITGIAIENFKGIRERVNVELRPLTLFFGGNSSGKSSIIHALHYAREVFERHNLNAGRTIDGDKYIDLGGFRSFVHGHDLETTVKIGLSLAGHDLPTFSESLFVTSYNEPPSFEGPLIDINDLSVEAEISWSPHLNAPFATKYLTNIDGQFITSIEAKPGRPRQRLTINLSHPAFEPLRDDLRNHLLRLTSFSPVDRPENIGDLIPENMSFFCKLVLQMCDVGMLPWESVCVNQQSKSLELIITIDAGADALPDLNKNIDIDINYSNLEKFWKEAKSRADKMYGKHGDGPFEGPKDHPSKEPKDPLSKESFQHTLDHFSEANPEPSPEFAYGLEEIFCEIIDQLVKGPEHLVRQDLQNLRYLGPLRETPSREYAPPKYPDDSRWPSGLGAWDALHNGTDRFVEQVSDWLGSEDKLNCGYHVERQSFKEVAVNGLIDNDEFNKIDLTKIPTQTRVVVVPSETKLELRLHDVGVGISQIVPVVAASLNAARHLLIIEQPELHLHPKLQAELADLFIESALGASKNTVILETHSELIPLRLMKRIREAREEGRDTKRPPITSKDVAIVYIETYDGATIATSLELGSDGQLLDPWPDGFFEEGFRERFNS